VKKFKCKICRRLGQSVCSRTKCAILRRPSPPGTQLKDRRRKISEYGMQLKEKQKLRYYYGLREKQFRNYIEDALSQRGKEEDSATLLIQRIESRFDNIIFRLGIASTRIQARQFVSHGYFLINNKPVDIPSYHLSIGDVVSVRLRLKEKNLFKMWKSQLKKYETCSWLKLDREKIEGKVIEKPSLEESAPPAEILSIFEFYSR